MFAFTLRQLEYFVAAAESGTLAAAARICHVTQAGIASAIGELESELNTQLLVRRKAKGVTMTPEGERVLALARRLLVDAEDIADLGRLGQNRVRLRVGCNLTLSPVLIPLVTTLVADELENVDLEFVEGTAAEVLGLLRDGELDAGLVFQRQVRGDAEVVPIRRIRPRVVLPAGHPLASRKGVHLRELSDEPAILPAEGSSHSIGLSLLHAAGVEPTVRGTYVSPETIRAMVARGHGYSVFHIAPPPEEQVDPRIVYVPVLDPIEGNELVLVLPPVRRQLHVIRDFLRVMHDRSVGAVLDGVPLMRPVS